MLELAIHLRAMQLFAHSAHHLCGRVAFFGDHEALGEFYSELDSAYDRVAERIVGSQGPEALPLHTIAAQVAQKLSQPVAAKENKDLFTKLLAMESELQQLGESLVKGPLPEGTKQLVGDELDKSLSRMYKIKRRLA